MPKKKKINPGIVFLIIIGLIMIGRQQGFLGAVTTLPFEFEQFDYVWECDGNIAGTAGLDLDLSDGLAGTFDPQCTSQISISNSQDYFFMRSYSGVYGGCGTSMSCRTTNFVPDGVEKVTILLSGNLLVNGEGIANAGMSRSGLSNSLNINNYPGGGVISASYSSIIITKIAENNWIVSDLATTTSINLQQLSFSISSSKDGGNAEGTTTMTINDIILTCEGGYEYNGAGQCIPVESCSTLSAQLGQDIDSWTRGLGVSRNDLGNSINNWVTC